MNLPPFYRNRGCLVRFKSGMYYVAWRWSLYMSFKCLCQLKIGIRVSIVSLNTILSVFENLPRLKLRNIGYKLGSLGPSTLLACFLGRPNKNSRLGTYLWLGNCLWSSLEVFRRRWKRVKLKLRIRLHFDNICQFVVLTQHFALQRLCSIYFGCVGTWYPEGSV